MAKPSKPLRDDELRHLIEWCEGRLKTVSPEGKPHIINVLVKARAELESRHVKGTR